MKSAACTAFILTPVQRTAPWYTFPCLGSMPESGFMATSASIYSETKPRDFITKNLKEKDEFTENINAIDNTVSN